MPSAMARSKRPPSLGKSAGARLVVMRRCGNLNYEQTMAARTRSRDSRTAVSGRPTIGCATGAGEKHFNVDVRRFYASTGTAMDH